MLKRNNRKGFTLAELLIVVAIIAILVAIAVPLFVGSLKKAQDARDNANIRAVRGEAIVYLLENTTNTTLWATPTNGWNVEATVSANGTISDLKIKNAKADTTYTVDGTVSAGTTAGTFAIKLHVDNTTITAGELS